MAMTAWEYKTFRLGEEPHPYKQYKLIERDLQSNEYRTDAEFQETVNAVRQAFVLEHQDNIAEWQTSSASLEAEAWVHKLARQSACELLAEGKVTSQTMLLMTLLGDGNFEECVRMGSQIATSLNTTVKGVEQELQTVPDHFMG